MEFVPDGYLKYVTIEGALGGIMISILRQEKL